MYRHDVIDKTMVRERVEQARDQTRRFLAGELSEDDFRHRDAGLAAPLGPR